MALVFVASTMMTTFAWSDFTQSKTNVFRGTIKTTSVTLHKSEKNQAGNLTGNKVANAKFKLFMQQSDETYTQINGIFTTNNLGQIKVHDLNVGTYYFEETEPSYGYEFDKDSENKNRTKYEFEITTEDVQKEKIVEVEAWNRKIDSSLDISKKVIGTSLPSDWEEKEFTFKVEFRNGNTIDENTYKYRINGGTEKSIKSGETLKLKHNETARFVTLPVGLQYSVTEIPDPDYTTSSKGANGHILEGKTSKAEFVNEYGTPTGTGELEISKKIRGEYPEQDKHKKFWFTLNVEGEEAVRFSLEDIESKTFEIPAGKKYTVTEDDYYNDEYVLVSEYTYNTTGTVTSAKIEVLFTNEYTGIIMIDPEGEKTWDISKAPQGTRLPESIEVQLINKKTGEVDQVKTVKPDTNGKWAYSFTAMKYDKDGNEIEYTVKEIPIGEYISTVTGMNIKNTYNDLSPVKYTPKVQKKLSGDKPEKDSIFEFKLKGENITNTARITGKGRVKFNAIKFTREGIYKYKITETKGKVAGYTYDKAIYTLTVKVKKEGGKLVIESAKYSKNGKSVTNAIFTNKYKYSQTDNKKRKIEGEKTWDHTGSSSKEVPDEITVVLKSGDKVIMQKSVSEKTNWKYSFTVPKFDKEGKRREYTIEEKNVEYYTATYDGYDIKNTFKSSDYPGDNPEETGDKSNPMLWIALMMISGILAILFFIIGRKYRKIR